MDDDVRHSNTYSNAPSMIDASEPPIVAAIDAQSLFGVKAPSWKIYIYTTLDLIRFSQT